MHDNKLSKEILHSSGVDEVVDFQWINNNLPNNIKQNMPSRMLYDFTMVRNYINVTNTESEIKIKTQFVHRLSSIRYLIKKI